MILLFKFDLSFIQPGCEFQSEPLGNDYKYDDDSDSAIHDIRFITLVAVAYGKITDTAAADYTHDGGVGYETDECSGKTDDKGTPRLHVQEFPDQLRRRHAHGPCCFKHPFRNIMKGLFHESCI